MLKSLYEKKYEKKSPLHYERGDGFDPWCLHDAKARL